MTPQELVNAFTRAAEQRNGEAFARLFTPDGVYHDVFYGEFKGTEKIAGMVNDWFYRHATDLRWDMLHPVSDGERLYTHYLFSYVSTMPEAGGKRVGFEGVSIMTLKDGKIAHYREVANTGPGLLDMNFPPERVAKILQKQGQLVRAQPAFARHL